MSPCIWYTSRLARRDPDRTAANGQRAKEGGGEYLELRGSLVVPWHLCSPSFIPLLRSSSCLFGSQALVSTSFPVLLTQSDLDLKRMYFPRGAARTELDLPEDRLRQ
ncbi:unnamed protein product [Pleuronectes platessa]|uniref:Uncharacterized protein n=1 Tax=Pleuronectes platessa TaxID=8262 RepID=A0A9N7UL97_PLEPL|nr:unnamed protein product [Pleuronectes platessa]